jgi:hypothetical protein
MRGDSILRIRIFFLATILAAAPTYAQVHKCKTPAGATVISSRPCEGQNKTVDIRQFERVSEEQYRQAEEVNQLRKSRLNQMAAEDAAFQMRIAEQAAAMRRTASPSQDAYRKKSCDEASTPLPGAHGLTASQRSVLASCSGLPAPPVQMPPSQPSNPPNFQSPYPPSIITSCDATGCWDTSGNRYQNAEGEMLIATMGNFAKKSEISSSAIESP